MYSVELYNQKRMNEAEKWASGFEILQWGNSLHCTRQCLDAVDFTKRIKHNPEYRWGYQKHFKTLNNEHELKIYFLFRDSDFALSFKLMGF